MRIRWIRNKITKSHRFLVLGLHIIILIVLCLIVLPIHAGRMFLWLDGTYMQFLSVYQHKWMSMFFYGMNMFAGLGDISFPLLLNLIPATWFAELFKSSLSFSVATYTFLAVQYFIGAYLLSRLFKFSQKISLFSAWLITLFVLPLLPTYKKFQLFYSITAISPYLLNFLFFCNLLVYCVYFIGKKGLFRSVLAGSISLIVIIYLVISNAVGILIALPFITLCCLAFILFPESKTELYTKVLFYIFVLLLLVLLHYFQFIAGLFLFSVPAFFPDTLSASYSLPTVSILFSLMQHIFVVGSFVSGFGLIGAILHFVFGKRKYRKYSIIFLSYALFILLFGVGTMIFPKWYHGPHTLYFEYMLWPLYMSYSVTLIIYLIKGLRFAILKAKIYWPTKTLFSFLSHFTTFLSGSKKFIYFLALILGGTLIGNYYYAKNYPSPRFVASSVDTLPIIKYLQKHSALRYGKNFNGYVATFAPKPVLNKGTTWFDQVVFDSLVLIPKFKNDYRLVGLWFYDIPTIIEYSPILSPTLYLMFSKILSRPIDKQIRSILLLTRINIPFLQVLGVRYIITNDLVYDNRVKLILSKTINKKHGSLYLYEVLDANIASYSPSKLLPLTHVDTFIRQIIRHKINFRKIAYVNDSVKYKLVKPITTSMSPIKNGYNIRANSRGISVIVLPILYSHCLHMKFHGKKPALFKLQRVNILESLLVFDTHIDVDITYRYGLMKYAYCRLEDKKAFKRILHM